MASQMREDATELRAAREKLKAEREIILIQKKESIEKQKRHLKERKQELLNKREAVLTAILDGNVRYMLDGNIVGAKLLTTLSPDRVRTISVYKGSDDVKEEDEEMTKYNNMIQNGHSMQ